MENEYNNGTNSDLQVKLVNKKSLAIRILKLIIILTPTMIISFLLNRAFSGTIAWGIFSIYPFMEHGIYIPDLTAPIALVTTLLELPIVILLSWLLSESNSKWKIYLNILLSFYSALITVSLIDYISHIFDNSFIFLIMLFVISIVYYYIFNKLNSVKKIFIPIPKNIVKEKILLIIYSILLLFVFVAISLFASWFEAFIICDGFDYECRVSLLIPIIFAIILLFLAVLAWWKVARKLKKRMIG